MNAQPSELREKGPSTETMLFMAAVILLPKADLQDHVTVLYIYIHVE